MYWEAWSALAEKLAAKRALEAAASNPWWLDQDVSEARAVSRQTTDTVRSTATGGEWSDPERTPGAHILVSASRAPRAALIALVGHHHPWG
jgi:hypothetical protein